MIKNKKPAESKNAKNKLYNLSLYPRAYMKNGDEDAGLKLSGYRTGNNGNKEYADIWVRPGDYSVREAKDGSYRVTLRAVDVEIVRKGDAEENEW